MNKKNKILFFLFSLIPGAAHMYIGLVKRGLVIMLALVAGAGLAMMTDTPALLLLLPVLWFVQLLRRMEQISSARGKARQGSGRLPVLLETVCRRTCAPIRALKRSLPQAC